MDIPRLENHININDIISLIEEMSVDKRSFFIFVCSTVAVLYIYVYNKVLDKQTRF